MEELVKHLIKQDIKHNQLINGLNELGLYDNERYTLRIVEVVGAILNTSLTDELLDYYNMCMLAMFPSTSDEEIELVVEKIYSKFKK